MSSANRFCRNGSFIAFPKLRGYRSLPEAIGQAAVGWRRMSGAAAILAFTQTGSTAAMVAKYRPAMPIYAVTPSQAVRRRLSLYAGVRSIRVDIRGDTEAQIRSVEEAVLAAGVVRKGDVVVITMGSPVSAPGPPTCSRCTGSARVNSMKYIDGAGSCIDPRSSLVPSSVRIQVR